MANPATIVRLLWKASRAVGAAETARRRGQGQNLAINIVKKANELRNNSPELQELDDDDEEAIARFLGNQQLRFTVDDRVFQVSRGDFL